MNKYKVIAISGKSASGKDTLLQRIVYQNNEVNEIINCTTRPLREGELDGIHYFFLSMDEFAHKDYHGEILAVSKFRDWYYGTPISSFKKNSINVGVFNPTGLWSLYNDDRIDLYVVLVQASDKVRLMRSLRREDNPDVDEIVRRYSADKADFEAFSKWYEPDYIFDSEGCGLSDIDDAARDIVLQAQRHWAEEAN